MEDGAVEEAGEDWDDNLTATQIAQRAFVVVGAGMVALGLALGFLPGSVGAVDCGSPWVPASPASPLAAMAGGAMFDGLTGFVCMHALGSRGTSAAIVAVLGGSFLLTALWLAVPVRRKE